MNELKQFIEIGEKKAGKQIELANILGITDVNIRMAKAGNRGLPDAICFLLADYIDVDAASVIAASNLVTEKNEERRKIFESYLKKSTSAAASLLIAVLATAILTFSPVKPIQAAHFGQVSNPSLYIMLNITYHKG